MSLYRCAICASPNVLKNKEKDGFSYKKAIAGTVVFGAIGAVAGIDGKTKEVYSCPDCGNTLPHPMDDITKAKIDYVMMDPDALMPTLFPNMFHLYPFLKKEHDMKHSKEMAETVSRLTNITPVHQNPLNVSEEEFRQSAKEIAEAFYLISLYLNFYDKYQRIPDLANEEVFSISLNNTHKADSKDIAFILQSLSKMKSVVYSLSHYRQLIHDQSGLKTGLSRVELRDLLLTYIMIEEKELTSQQLYYLVNSNSTLKQAFMLVMDDVEKYAEEVARAQGKDDRFRTEYTIRAWYNHIQSCYNPCNITWNCIRSDYYSPFNFSWLASTPVTTSRIKSRICVVDNELHFLHVTKDIKNRLSNLSSKESKALSDLQNEIDSIKKELNENKKSSYDKTGELQEIQNLEQKVSSNQGTIQRLQKVMLFGKKKAQAEADVLIKENEKAKLQIEELKQKIQYNEKKWYKDKADKEKQLEQKLDFARIEYIQILQDIHWFPVR